MKSLKVGRLRGAFLMVLLLGAVFCASAQLSISLLPDSVSIAGGMFLAVASLGLPASTKEMPVEIDLVNGFDRAAMFPYSPELDLASDVAQYAAAALPLALALMISTDQTLAAGVIYFEVLSRAFFAKNTLKFLFPRVRPWLYLAPTTGSVPDVWEGNDSSPPGTRPWRSLPRRSESRWLRWIFPPGRLRTCST